MNDSDPDRWDRLERLFRRALDRPPEEWPRLLDGLSGEDAALRSELASLLEAHRVTGGQGGEFLSGLDPALAGALLAGGSPPGSPTPGDSVGPYRLLGILGRGGMGVVYLAEDPRLDRKVALKLLPRWLSADPRAGERFVAEARAASGLDHPNIATIYEIDETEDGRRYIAMAHYEGETLADRIARGPLEVEEAVDIAAQVADGLAAAHARGIVHRDVKPGNVMLTPDGTVRILDFGVAKMTTGRTLTRTGATPGTVAYMSPEQTRGGELDGRSDLWSLGVLLHEMLAGERPFRAGGSEALVYQIRHDDPEELEELRPEVPDRLSRVVERCLEKDPSRRPAAASELAAALRGEAPPGPSGPGWRPGRRALAAALAVATLLAAAYGSWHLLRGPPGGGGTADGASIAVLPFENLSGTEAARPLARGIHDDLLVRLSGIGGLRVISRRAVRRYRDSDRSAAAVAAELGVRWVLEGGVEKRGNRLRASVRLVDPRTESQAWARSYRRDLTARDLFALQGEIALDIVRSLEARLTPEERERLRRRPTDDLAAYRHYVEGRTHLDQRSESGLRQGTVLFRRAIALDSTYAPAWAGLADALTLLAYYGYASRDTVLEPALDAAERALRLDSGLAEAHASRALIHQSLRYDGPVALRELRRAVELKPSYARAYHWLGSLLMNLGRLAEAGEPLRRAVELDPTSPPIRVTLSRWYQYADSLDAALEEARRAGELSPSFPGALMLAGEALRGMGRLEEARDELRRALELPGANVRGSPGIWVELALVHRSLGDTARARELVERLEAEAPPLVLAAVQAGMGRRDMALALLSAAPVVPDVAVILRYQAVFDSVRGDPRFEEVLRAYDRAWGLGADGDLPAGAARRHGDSGSRVRRGPGGAGRAPAAHHPRPRASTPAADLIPRRRSSRSG